MTENADLNKIYKNLNNCSTKSKIYTTLGIAFVVALLIIALVFGLENNGSNLKKRKNSNQSISENGEFPQAAVSADGLPCPTIGKDVLLDGGNAIDSAIATLFCLGVVNAQSMGLGGGFFLTYYEKSSQTAYSLDAREVAPDAAHKDMYDEEAEPSRNGGLAVAVPGEIRGYREAYDTFGGEVSWERLIEPTAKLCEDGFVVNRHMANALAVKESEILSQPSMSVYINPLTGKLYLEGETIRMPALASTLRVLQNEPDAVHNGSLTDGFIQDLNELGSIITREDMENYRPIWRQPDAMKFSDRYTLFSTPPPGSGLILGYIMKILQHYNFTKESVSDENIVTTYQRIVEALKFGYARRTELGDMDFSDMTSLIEDLTSDSFALESYEKIMDNATSQDPTYYGSKYSLTVEDYGTSHMAVVGPNGDAVSVTSTVNLYFGACIMSTSTGIVLNNEMNDFSIPGVVNEFDMPPFEANYIEPGKRPVSSMCPVVIIDENGDVILVNGAAGGTRISSSVAWTSIHNIWLGSNIEESIDLKRMHHQLYPMELNLEFEFDESIMTALQDIGHIVTMSSSAVGGSAVTGIERMDDGGLKAFSDGRKGGGVDGF